MHTKVVHFLSLYGLSAKSTLFKCHKCIVKTSIWQKYLWIKIANLNKNIYWRVISINIHQSYSNGLLKWAYGPCFGFYINSQMHFLLWFYLNMLLSKFNIGKKMDLKKLQKNFNQQITMDFWMTKFGPYFPKSLQNGRGNYIQ